MSTGSDLASPSWPTNGIVADHRGRVIVETAWSADLLEQTLNLGGLRREMALVTDRSMG
jgi:hypothetical protein